MGAPPKHLGISHMWSYLRRECQDGSSCLHLAADGSYGDLNAKQEIIELLIFNGASLDGRNNVSKR
jgi:Ankyrin repeat